MATTSPSSSSAASSSGTISPEESRPQAGPLPLKRGEIGFREDLVKEEAGESEHSTDALPERHPADRDAPPSATTPQNASTPTPSSTPSTTAPLPPPPPTSDDASSTASLKKRKRIFSFLKRKKYAGLQLGTLLAFMIQLFLILGTIASWVVAGVFLSGKTQTSNDSSSSSDSSMSAASSSIFVHVVFAVAFLTQCLFLERRIYVLRAQRYAFLHPGEILPTSRRRGQFADTSVGISPWNRPPLPTYAAALAQSGVGTGDVEDHLIAAPPPPAYGNTRGSTLLLTGFLNATLRAQRPVSARTEMSQQQDRPVSYASRDDDWEVIQDADRARQLEETLSRLERPGSRQLPSR
ncbi:hypothetical protein BT96DRAFT_962536 [Gymnopus androsaceus JB14]|uniref:Uncharacterized protein n=1 Tax=Gymnopus androsaceus JB14 TaxID=1447944 RepID=A0A6A4IK40_9AGAR|nr:hypothetical protein BT96DRAFT_962536 [Gymnopus androsaceus JB14]